jgi:hypothetical protein
MRGKPRCELIKLFHEEDMPASIKRGWGDHYVEDWIESRTVVASPRDRPDLQELDDWLLAHGAAHGETVMIKTEWRAPAERDGESDWDLD